MQRMFDPVYGSPRARLINPIDSSQTTIDIDDVSFLTAPEGIATISTGADSETITYTGITGNTLTGVTRGFRGQAQSWGPGEEIARIVNAYDFEAFKGNIEKVKGEVGDLAQLNQNKDNLVSALNEIDDTLWNNDQLNTTAQSVTGAINEIDGEARDLKKLLVNDNLLINGGFQVWQRGESFPNQNPGRYTTDRLLVWAGGSSVAGVYKNNNGAILTGTIVGNEGRVYEYRFESDFCTRWLKDKTVTFSCSIDGSKFSTTFDFVSGWQAKGITSSISLEADGTIPMIRLVIRDDLNYLLNWWKLELGSVATDFFLPEYGSELAKCQRYFQALTNGFQSRAAEVLTDNIDFQVPLTVSTRVRPTIVNGENLIVKTVTGTNQSGFTFSVQAGGKETSFVRIRGNKVGHGLSDGLLASPQATYLDAEMY